VVARAARGGLRRGRAGDGEDDIGGAGPGGRPRGGRRWGRASDGVHDVGSGDAGVRRVAWDQAGGAGPGR
jgi:hypothetical protein